MEADDSKEAAGSRALAFQFDNLMNFPANQYILLAPGEPLGDKYRGNDLNLEQMESVNETIDRQDN